MSKPDILINSLKKTCDTLPHPRVAFVELPAMQFCTAHYVLEVLIVWP
jgi:hypothetical protein